MDSKMLRNINFWSCIYEYKVSNVAQSYFKNKYGEGCMDASECSVVTGGCPTDACATGSPCE